MNPEQVRSKLKLTGSTARNTAPDTAREAGNRYPGDSQKRGVTARSIKG